MFIKTTLDKDQSVKVKSDLAFLSRLLVFCKQQGLRLVVSGGYGLDGIVGEITRYHNDLDVIIYSTQTRDEAINLIKQFALSVYPQSRIKISTNSFLVDLDINVSGFGANIYYVRTVNDPYKNILEIELEDGTVHTNSESRFPSPVKAKIGKLRFEAENPNLHLADILYKSNKSQKLAKHNQDIINLNLIIDKKSVDSILAQY